MESNYINELFITDSDKTNIRQLGIKEKYV